MHREAQTRMHRQKYQEFDGLFQFIMNVDDQPEVAIAINNELSDIAQVIAKLNPKNEEYAVFLDQLKSRGSALRDGSLAPKGNKAVSSDTLMRTHTSSLIEIGQRLNRLKIRGKISVPAYEEYLQHLKHLTFEVEYDSHMSFAKKLEENKDIRNAINHFKHARDALKKTRLEIPEKNQNIRELSEKIQALQRSGSSPEESMAAQEEAPQPAAVQGSGVDSAASKKKW